MPHSVLSHRASGPRAGLRRAAPAVHGWQPTERIALRLERVAGQIVFLEIGVEIVLGPVAERVDLEPAVLDLEARQVLAGDRLERLAAGYPAVEPGLARGQRLDLADLAAAVGIVGPAQAASSFAASTAGSGVTDRVVAQAEARDQLLAIGQRFGEHLERIDEDHRGRRIGLRDEVQQHRAFGAERRHHRHAPERAFGEQRRAASSRVSTPAKRALSASASACVKRGRGVDHVDSRG